MSEYHVQRWQINQQRRRELYLERIRLTTVQYHRRYESVLHDLRREGLEKYVPREFERIRGQLSRVESLLSSNPESARDLNVSIGPEVAALPSVARAARREFQIREEARRRELEEMRRRATSELANFIVEKIASITDPIEQDFAFDELRAIQAEFEARKVDPEELSRFKLDVEQRLNGIRSSAADKAQAWKESRSTKLMDESTEDLIEIHRDQLESARERSPAVVDSLLARLDDLARQAKSGEIRGDLLGKQLGALCEAADVALADEACRREVVRALVESLERLGFIVPTPQRPPGDRDEVLITAKKPAGQTADFRITVDGSWVAKFEKYEGMGCKADIDKMDALLEEIYGVNLSDKRIDWQNPDRRSADERPLDSGKGRDGHE